MYTTARRVLLASFVLVAAAACTNLTEEPKSTVNSTSIFKDTTSYRAFIAKIYGGLQVTGQQGPAGQPDIQGIDEGFSQYIRLWWQMEELPTDEAVIAWNDAGVQELNTQGWSPLNQFLGAMYSRIYFQVGLANEFLRETTDEKLAARGVSDALKAQIHQYRAEARFLRALSYWHGIDLFGNIPLVKEDFPLGTTPPQQATRAEVYAFVVQDLNDLRGDLPPAGQGEYGRADQGAVDMLLGKLYLNGQVYAGEDHYADARAAMERVIGSGAYQLEPNYMLNFLADNNTSRELIFAVPYDGQHTQSYGGTTYLTHAAVGGAMDPHALGLDGGWFGLRIRPEIVALFPGVGPASADHRASFIFSTGQTEAIHSLTDFTQGLGAPKYQNVTSTGAPGSNPGFADVDYPMFRLADAYLMYAEAVLRGGGGDRATALTYINDLRARAYGGNSGAITDAQLTLDFILDERARELLWEGNRRTDLVRFGRFSGGGTWAWKGGVEAGRTTEAFHDLYPLPASELIANPNLTQNPGY